MKVCVVGGSNGGYAMAGDLALRGHEVFWYVRDHTRHEAVLSQPSLELTGVGVTGRADLALVSDDLGLVLENANTVLVPLPSFSHWQLIEDIIPCLRDGQLVLFTPGTLLTSFYAHRQLRLRRPEIDVLFGESSTLPYGTRRTGQRRVNINCLVTHNPVSVIPPQRLPEVFPALSVLYDSFIPVRDVLDSALNNQAPITQPAGMLLNTGYVENVRDFHLHRDGVTPSVLNVEVAVDGERVSVRRALGLQAPDYPLLEFYRPGSTGDRALFSQVINLVNETPDYEEFYDTFMPYEGVNHRYFLEACGEGLVFIHSLGKALGLPMSLSESVIRLSSVVSKKDYLSEGRTLEKVGIHSGKAFDEFLIQIRG